MRILFSAIFILFIGSCSTTTKNEDIFIGYEYFPLNVGNRYVYAFDSIAFDDNTKSTDTFHYILTRQIDTFFINSSNQKVYLFSQSVKDTSNDRVETRPNFFVERNTQQLIFTENNIPFVKLVFPIGNIKNWNGNMLNTNNRQTYNLTQFNIKKGSQIFTRVQEANNINAIEEDIAYAVYTLNFGLTEYYKKYINKQVSGTSGYIIHIKNIGGEIK